MDVILNASIANAIKPDITNLPCEADSTGKGMMPVGGGAQNVCVCFCLAAGNRVPFSQCTEKAL